ncbi:hypothetical protein OAN307_c01860 [Octadecabacter antarcticus 307]|uniref:Uncharacterized protein n=1 Tax=Octadecabacter antarcticus 307 TaxID=391626 RepID=M9R2J0_9RHOB|nr:hypothetical protein [Octadecabacter antarcticus]AGI65953.1 hypothetical protein OAN307_c01860 [Octadecabacter antarcticus 307]
MIKVALTQQAKQAATSDYSDEWHTVLIKAHASGLVDDPTFQQLAGKYAVELIHSHDFITKVREALANGPAPEMGLDALAEFYLPTDVVELRVIDPAGCGAVSYCGVIGDPVQRTKMVAFIRKYYGLRNIYIGINIRRADMADTNLTASAGDVIARRAMVFDFDSKDAPVDDPTWSNALADLVYEDLSNFVMDSGNGFHVWTKWDQWPGACTPENLADSVPAAANMERVMRADSMSDLPRIARLPFTLNLPTATKRKRGATIKMAVSVKGAKA